METIVTIEKDAISIVHKMSDDEWEEWIREMRKIVFGS